MPRGKMPSVFSKFDEFPKFSVKLQRNSHYYLQIPEKSGILCIISIIADIIAKSIHI